MPVTVVARNKMNGPTVLASDIKGTHSVEWAAYGDESGEDIQYIPEAVLESVAFKRALARGVVELMADATDPEVVDALDKQVEAFKKRQAGAQDDARRAIDRQTDREYVAALCIGPGNWGTGTCGEPLTLTKNAVKDVPPLCPKHKDLANQFVPEQDTRQVDGKVIQDVKWIRMRMGARERD